MPPTASAVKVIDTPDGPVDFPATMSDAAITAVLRKRYGGPFPAPAGLTQDERVRWATALPGTPEGQRTRAAIAAAHGGSRAVEAELDPVSLALGEHVLPMAPWLLMGAIPGSTPLLASLAARAGIAGTIGAAESPPGSRGRGALTGIAEQAAGELAAPLVAAGQRVGSRALDRVSDVLADRLMRGAKQLVPWWRGLPDGQRGVDALLTDQGRTVLSERYGDALRQAMGTALKGQKIPVPAADATTLALTPRSAVFPNGNVLVDADAAAVAAATAGRSSVAGQHVTEAVTALVDVLKKTNPPAAQRIAAVLSGDALTQEKRLFAEGVNLIESLRAMKVLDRVRKRLDPEALVKGFAATFGSTHPQAVWDRWLTMTKAPGARALVQDLKRAAPPTAPQRIGLPFIRVPILHSHAALGEHVPLTLGVRGIPRTPAEQDVVRRLAPTVGGALSRTALDPALASSEERPTAPAPVPSTRSSTISPFNQGPWPTPEELARRDTLIREQVQKMQRENPSLYRRLPLLHQEARP